MTTSWWFIFVIIAAMVVTSIPRLVPFMLSSKFELPIIVIRWLNYVPICLFIALVISSIVTQEGSRGYHLSGVSIMTTILTFLIAFKTKNLLITVIAGILFMFILRLLFG